MPAPCSASTLKRLAWCKMGNGKKSIFDPRAGLWILIAANIIAFSDHTLWVELALIALLLALMIVHRRFTMAVKWAVGYCALLVFQQVILPASPMIIATSFTIFATYTRRMFPCLMTGSLMLKCTIRDAMKLRNIRGLSRLECTVMPLMVSATETAEELSAAAVTRGIENPARKTSAVSLRLMPADLTGMLLVLALLIGSFVVQ